MNLLQAFKEFFTKRKIRADIITIFITLFIIAFLIISFFNYTRYRADILSLSKETMKLVNKNVIAQIRNIKAQMELIALTTSSLIVSKKMVSLEHRDLITYLIGA